MNIIFRFRTSKNISGSKIYPKKRVGNSASVLPYFIPFSPQSPSLTCSTHLFGFPTCRAQPYRIVQGEGGREPAKRGFAGDCTRECTTNPQGEPASAEQDTVNCSII